MNEIIRVGIIGTGKHGSRYAGHIVNDLKECFQLAAISRRSPVARKQAAAWQAAWYSDWRELVASNNVDAVIAVTTPDLNVEIARFCVAQKKPLLIEKPLTTDYFLAQEIVSLFSDNALKLTVAQTLRYNSVILALRQNFKQMGRLFSLSASHRLEPSTLSWLEEPAVAGGGVIFHTAVHLFDALRFILTDEVVRIRAVSQNVFNPQLEDLMVAELVFASGALGIVDTSKVSPSRAGKYEFVCENGQLQGDQIHGYVQKIVASKVTEIPVSPPGPALLPLLADWYTYLAGKGDNPIPAEEGLAAVKICHACRESASSGQWVDLGDF
jgi:predicted dehydrogenase